MSAPILQMSGATVKPGGPEGPAVLEACSLSIQKGESVALVGESGAGKTTLLRTLAGLLPLEAGRLRSPDRIGWLPQHPLASFDPRWTVLRSVAEPARLAGRSKEDALEGARKVLQSLKLSATQWNIRPHGLSGGQIRRAAIGRALVADPPLVLADEPTAGLDPVAGLSLAELLLERVRARGSSLLWATHDMGMAGILSDRVLVLDRGRIVEAAPMRALVERPRSATARRLLGAWLPLDPREARRQLKEPGSVRPDVEMWEPPPSEEDEEF